VTEGAGKASRAENSAASARDNHLEGPSLSTEERDAVDLLTSLDFEYAGSDNTNLAFRRTRDSRLGLPLSPRSYFPRAYVPMLLGQLGDRVEGHSAATGLMIPSRGYAELLCSRLPPAVAKRIFRLEPYDQDCLHMAPASELASLPYHWPDEDGRQSVRRIHLSGRDGKPCLEISNASPLAGLIYGQTLESARVRLTSPRIPLLITLKMVYDRPASDAKVLARNSEQAARSLTYELNVRNGVLVELVALPAGTSAGVTHRPPEASNKIRYPLAKLYNEVAIRFGFASQVVGDPPQAFLSYYQALEYFIPIAMQQSAIKKVRRELLDLDFANANDASLLRVVQAAKGPPGAGEQDQLRIVVSEYVRSDRLKEFFEHGWGNYFGDKGPIKEAPAINAKNTGQILSREVADRIYHIRNRIVHAKDDPKYKVLLPRSGEANALIPDVFLVRLLAIEAISAFTP
jgi:hypothetical protein